VTLAAGGEPITAEFELPILMYHRALPELPPDDPEGLSTVTTAELEAELAYLRCAGYTTMTVAQMFDVLDGKLRMPERPIILTFDDGTADHYSYVFPLLRRYGLTASFSIVTGTVGQGKEYLTWEQVREMSGAGMEMLSHTVTHLNLNEADESEIAAELAEAKETLEEQTGQPVRYFVYPSGEPFRSGTADREVAVATMLRQTGYRGALLAGLSQVTQDPSRPFQLHRMRIWNGQELAVFAGAMYGPAPEDYGCGTTAVLRDGSDSH
jgi:peptidoglycan/xylan/chitin deacetylase (PgdA/CDA1 family)